MSTKQDAFEHIAAMTPDERKQLMRDARKSIGDVPVKMAVLAWNTTHHGEDGRIMVVKHDVESREFCGPMEDRLGLTSTYGSCNLGFNSGTVKQVCHRLLVEAWNITIRDGLDIRDVHEALMAVPEMREIIGENAPWPYEG